MHIGGKQATTMNIATILITGTLLLGQVISHLGKRDGRRALDIGCGRGRNVRNLRAVGNWAGVDGIDLSEVNVRKCRNEFKWSKC